MPFPSLVRGERRPLQDDFRPGTVWPSASGPRLPLAVRVGDAVTIVLLVAAVAVALSGGFRERYGEVLIIVESWVRLLMAAFAVAAVRHALRPAPSIVRRVATAVAAAWSSRVVRTVLVVAVVTRLTVLAAGYFAFVVINPVRRPPPLLEREDMLTKLTGRWDALWYLRIVRDGYHWDGNRNLQQNVVFFPALPIAMYAAGLLAGKRWLVGGTIVAIVCFAWGLTYLYRLAREQLGEEAAASAVWLLATYPFAVYFSAPYTESLYLLATIGAIYHATRNESWSAVGWGLVAGLCRPNGFLLSVPLALLLAGPGFVRWLYKRLPGPGERTFRFADAAVVIAPIVGLGLYSAYLWVRFDEPLAWQLGQQAWGRRYGGVWTGLATLFTHRWDAIAQTGFIGYTRVQAIDFLNTCAAVFVIGTIVPLTLRLGVAYGALVALNLFPPLLFGGMLSIGRMTSVMFPVFLWLATVVSPSRLPAWTAAFAVFQGLIAALFFTGRPAY
jgi:hypothetical protein